MRIRKINFQEINFEYRSYPQSMYDSVRRIGLSFPIKVDIIDGQYYCKDGHKRLSIIQDVPYIIYNDGSSRSNDCWRDRNMH